MLKEDLTILIVDDDITFGKAMKEAMSRAGFKAMHASKPDDALSSIKLQPIHAAIIDCMLPKMNGKDLAKKIKEETSASLPVLLISGIYKDKNFAREAMQSTGAIGFITKPFELASLVKTIEDKLEHMIDAPLAPLQSLLVKHEISSKERIRAVNETEEVHGFDLPWIYSVLMHPRVNGHLNIISADGEVCGVGFQKGSIVQVNQKDAKSYFGVLMVENGFISQAEIEEVMQHGGKTKKMGERLVESNVLSPHAIQIVMAEQQGLRLSKTVANTSVKVNFIESDEMREDAILDRTAFTELLGEWLNSKVTGEWLKSEYMPWMRFNIKKGPEFSPSHRVLSVPVVQRIPKLIDTLLAADTLENALSEIKQSEEDVFRALHALLITRIVRFGDQKTHQDYEAQRKRLTKINEDLKHQSHFERLGISQKAKESEIKRAYHELAKIFHPDKLAPDSPNDIRELTREAFNKINQAYEALSNPAAKEAYLAELEQGRAESVLQAEQYTEQARPLLTKGDIRKGRELLERAVTLAPPTTETRLLLMWAKLKTPGTEKDPQAIDAIKDEIGKIPPEDRHVPTYYFVKGLLMKALGDLDAARKSFEHAVSMASDFIDARRELNVIALQKNNKPTDLLRGDLKDVVGLLFKKKK